MASAHRPLAKGDEATHSSRSWETKRVPQTLGSTQTHKRHTKLENAVRRERHNKRKGGGPKEKDKGLDSQPFGNPTSLQTHCATFYHIKPPRDPSIRMQLTLQIV